MKFLRLLKQHYLIASIVAFALILALVFAGGGAMESVGGYLAGSKLQKLEQEKQAAKEQNLKLQGQVDAKDVEIGRLNDQIKNSDQAVIAAGQRTATAQASVNKVRTSKPVFNSPDDAGRVEELRAELDRLYPNP